jgi:hypothetical protein
MMKKRNLVRGTVLFLAGFLTAVILQSDFTGLKEALADQYACIRQDLDARAMTGNIPDPAFTIIYTVPACYSDSGYSVERVYMYGNEVAVSYRNPNPGPSVRSMVPKAQSGFRAIP